MLCLLACLCFPVSVGWLVGEWTTGWLGCLPQEKGCRLLDLRDVVLSPVHPVFVECLSKRRPIQITERMKHTG